MTYRSLTALPVYNEARHLNSVLDQVCHFSSDVLVVDDGSTDGTAELLARRDDVHVISHPANRGYGAALRTAFGAATERGFDVIITIDCDGQHEPQRIPRFVQASHDYDIVSGSRYLELFPEDNAPPPERRRVNEQITTELNRRLNLSLTDAFCGFKAYRTAAARTMGRRGGGRAFHQRAGSSVNLPGRSKVVWWTTGRCSNPDRLLPKGTQS